MERELTSVEQQLLDYLKVQAGSQRKPGVEDIVREVYGKEIPIGPRNLKFLMRNVYEVLEGLARAGLIVDTNAVRSPSTRTERMNGSRWTIR